MQPQQNHHSQKEWHDDMTMDPIMITLVCCSWMYSYTVILKDTYANNPNAWGPTGASEWVVLVMGCQ